MPDYERSATIGAAPATAFAYLAEAGNLPKYVSFMTEAAPAGTNGLHVAADVQGRHEEGDATFTADEGTRTIKWGRAGSEYRGWLSVTPDATGSRVTIHLHTQGDADAAEIEQAIGDSLANIRTAAATM